MIRRLAGRWSLGLALVVASARVLAAQAVTGVVRDSASGGPIAGAVVTLVDGNSASLGRAITNERGEYRIAVSAAARRIRVIHIGFRPSDVALPSPAASNKVDVAMARLATLLQAVHVNDESRCPRRDDQPAALALWSQTQAALLASIVAREANPAEQLRLTFQRWMEDNGDHISHLSVRIASAQHAADSFGAAMSAAQFVAQGFAIDSEGVVNYFGPDAGVLLDEAFATGYCFRLVSADKSRPNQVGIGFDPAQRRTGRRDITGTAWVDTSARTLREVEFKYLGFDRRIAAFNPGGRLEFREMPNGVVLIDRWHLRMVSARDDSAAGPRGETVVRQMFFAQESGGELARAEWPSGAKWEASLGTVFGRVLGGNGRSPVGATIVLDDTDYETRVRPDSTFEITHLLPGPYEVRVRDSTLGPLGLTMPAKVLFLAARDSTRRVTFELPTLTSFASEACEAYGKEDHLARVLILARVEDRDGKPLADATWAAAVPNIDERLPGGMQVIRNGRTGKDGFAPICHRLVVPGRPVRITAKRADGWLSDTTFIASRDAVVIRLAPTKR